MNCANTEKIKVRLRYIVAGFQNFVIIHSLISKCITVLKFVFNHCM